MNIPNRPRPELSILRDAAGTMAMMREEQARLVREFTEQLSLALPVEFTEHPLVRAVNWSYQGGHPRIVGFVTHGLLRDCRGEIAYAFPVSLPVLRDHLEWVINPQYGCWEECGSLRTPDEFRRAMEEGPIQMLREAWAGAVEVQVIDPDPQVRIERRMWSVRFSLPVAPVSE